MKIVKAVTGKAPHKPAGDWKAHKKSGGRFFDTPEASSSLPRKLKGVKSVGQLAGYDTHDSSDGYSDCHKHLRRDLKNRQPKRGSVLQKISRMTLQDLIL